MSAAPPLELTVLMPCLNEAETLAACIRKARVCLARLGIDGEVLVADNGSTDGSQQIALEEGARVVAVAERGYGAALYQGALEAHGRFIIMGDADDSYDFSRLDAFVQHLRGGAELVMGNRFLGGIVPGAMPWKNQHIGNPLLSAIGRLFFASPARDFHCGLRGFTRDAFERMELRTTGMEFASEMVIKATLLGMRIIEVPTTLGKDGRSRPPHLRPWRDGWRHLRFMLLYSPRWLFLYPGLALMAGGALLGAWLIGGPIVIGNVGFDVQTLLYCAAAMIIGLQAVLFALFAKVYATNSGLVPPDPRLGRAFNYVTLESGLGLGALLALAGLAGSVYAISLWGEAGYGPLQVSRSLRVIVPSITTLILGLQILLGSFFLSVLGLQIR